MIPVLPPAPDESWFVRFRKGVRHPVQYLQEVTGGNPVYPLLILFGLNAVDELDRTAFGVLLPNIQEAFGLDLSGILTVVAVVFGLALALQVPVAHFADRTNRVRLAILGSVVMAVFSFGTGLATAVWMLYIARAGSALGKTTIDPTHNSLLADYYPPEQRPRVYSFHRAANTLGQFLGPLIGGVVAFYFGWQAPFFLFAIPIAVLAVLALRLPEPVRGAQERRAMGSSEDVIATEEPPPSFAEGWRMVRKVQTLRRIFYALPFLAAALIGFATLGSLKYQELGLNEAERGFVAAAAEPFAFLGLYLGARWGTKLIQKDPGEVIRFIGLISFVAAIFAAMFALAPNVPVAVGANIGISIVLAILAPGVFASLSLAIPPRARALGFSMGSLWVLPGIIVFPLVGVVGDAFGISWGMLLMTPVFVVGGLIISSAAKHMKGDIAQVWGAAAARSEVLYDRREGRSKLLLVRKLNVSYGPVQILFDIDFEVDEGEIIALLGTNGAGKSTLLKAIAGVVQAERGTVILDGRDITHMPPNEVASHGIAQVPGGQGVFPTLSVAENLRVAGWIDRRQPAVRDARIAEVLEMFPVLAERLEDPAGNLSGGQQQMLALGMAFLTRPKLLCIDELSLGLAPVVVEQLLGIVRAMRDQGTTVILVEQSVNVALTVAETAYFMEKGEFRFHGPTAELLDRPDVLRSVFLEGAGKGLGAGSGNGEGGAPAIVVREPSELIRHDVPAGLELHGLSVSFGGIRAVSEVSLAVPQGEILGIIGPNGAGKTTLFDLISGHTRAEAGRVVLGGVDVTERSPDQRAIAGLGRSFQDARLFPSLTVEETIKVSFDRWVDVRDPFNAALRLPAAFDSEAEVAEWTDQLIELLGLESFRSKLVRELSTGSRRVVDLACVMAHRPDVVLLDEPSSGIAQREAEALAPLLLRLRESLGASVLLIEHDMPLVCEVSDRILALDQGEVVVEGSADEVLHHPHVVASYLGTTEEVIARSGAREGTGRRAGDEGADAGVHGGARVTGIGRRSHAGRRGGRHGRGHAGPGDPGGAGWSGRSAGRGGAGKWVPLAVLAVVVIGGLGIALATGGGDDDSSSDTTVAPGEQALPDGVIPFSVAEERGIVDDIDWGQRCDVERGQLAYPSFFAGECFAPFDGDNGGATAPGVTADTVTVVQYLTPEVDPVIDFITGAISLDDTNAETFETLQNWVDFYNDFFETYGRTVELVLYEGSGPSDDAVSARADAVQIAEEIQPFAVFGGPLLVNAFAEELAARDILCISCTPGQPDQFYLDNAPYVWGVSNNPEQGQAHTAEYIGKRLAGRPAEHAGDPALATEERVFGLVYLETGEESAELADEFEAKLADRDVELAAREAYASPVDLQTGAESLIAKLKDAGVTSVIFSGDPVAPQPLTLAATSQDYAPEWIVTGSALVDTTTFARTYDQEQWAHTFGVSTLSARVSPDVAGGLFLYRWYFGDNPPASSGAPTLVPNISLFFAVIQGVGPDLTAETFSSTLRGADPTRRAITQPSLSYGDKGIWPVTDYLGIDDATEIWWDPAATGPDEIQREGTGMWRYVDGGTRYLPGEWPETAPDVFTDEGSITIYTEAPAAEVVPTYEEPR